MTTMTANSTSALKCESNNFDHWDCPSATCHHDGQLSPALPVMSMAPNAPAAENNITDKMMHKIPAEIESTEFSDSDDDEGLPGYPTWGSSWSIRSLRTPDPKPVQSPMTSLEEHQDRPSTRTLHKPTCTVSLELTYYRTAPLNELNHRALSV